jgi:hypothetical protein
MMQNLHGLSSRPEIFPGQQCRHTYATEVLRSGVSFPVLMKLLGHVSPEMTMRYVDVALTDPQREFQLVHDKPRHLASQHALEMFRRSLPNSDKRARLDRLANRLTKILAEIRKLQTT